MAVRKNASTKADSDNYEPKAASTHMILTMDYTCQYVIPIKYGTMILDALSHARRYEKNYSKEPAMQPTAGDFSVEYLTLEKVRELVLESKLEGTS